MDRNGTLTAGIDSPLNPAELAKLTGDMLDRVTYCFVVFDAQGRYLHINATHALLLAELGHDARSLIGQQAFEWAAPALREQTRAIVRQVGRSGKPYYEEVWLPKLGKCYRQCFVALSGGLVGMLSHDITEQSHAKKNAAFLAEVQHALYHCSDVAGIAAVMREKTCAYFDLASLTFAEIDEAHGYAKALAEFDAAGMPPHVACFPLKAFLSNAALAELACGRILAIADIERDARTRVRASAYLTYETRAMLVAPYLSNGRWVFTLTGICHAPRDWQADECELFQELAARSYLHLEIARSGAALRAMAAQALRAQEELAVSNERLNLAIEGSGDGVIDYEVARECHAMSRRAWEILGYEKAPEPPLFHCWRDIVHPDEQADFDAQLAAVLDQDCPSLNCEHRVRCRDGSWKWVQLRAHVVGRDAQGRAQRLTGLLSDVSEKRRSEEIIWGQANFDALTGLPNRRLFRDRLEHELKKSLRVNLPVALLFIDLDRFKEVNDLFGHAAGDALLVQAARRISACVRSSDTVARLGGDEFTAVLPDLDDMRHAQSVAQKIIETLALPFTLEGESVEISASIGITLFPSDAQDAEDLVRNADQAMYAAKSAGRNQFSYFTPQMRSSSTIRTLPMPRPPVRMARGSTP